MILISSRIMKDSIGLGGPGDERLVKKAFLLCRQFANKQISWVALAEKSSSFDAGNYNILRHHHLVETMEDCHKAKWLADLGFKY
jgi:hypothetical protein